MYALLSADNKVDNRDIRGWGHRISHHHTHTCYPLSHHQYFALHSHSVRCHDFTLKQWQTRWTWGVSHHFTNPVATANAVHAMSPNPCG